MNKRNYYKELENKIDEFQKNGVVPKLLLHVCCAPCSSHCLEFLRQYFDVTVFFYNPNITEDREYHKRVAEEKRLIEEYNRQVEEKNFEGMHSDEHARKIAIIEGEYDPKEYFEAVKGYEDIPEGGERCRKCFELRLRKTAETAAKEGFEYFTTTLTISPLKNADVLNEIGEKVAGKAVSFLPSDFKKKDGYKRSIELSQRFCLYRQDYCGCGFSKAERERQKAEDKGK